MSVREVFDVAARLSRLHIEAFAGSRRSKLLRISHDDFYRVAELQTLRAAKYREIAAQLLKQHALILGRGADFFVLIPSDTGANWEILNRSSVTRELKRKAPLQGATQALSPQAAWPFPTGSKP